MCRMFYKVFDSDLDAKNYLNGLCIPEETEHCFSKYKYIYQEDKNIYFGFYADPKVLDLIEELNNNFSNIKISVAEFKEMPWKSDVGFYKPEYTGERVYLKSGPEKYTYILFTINFDEGYTSNSKYVLTYALAQFIRGFCPEYEHYIRACKLTDNYIDGILNVQDSRMYGAWMCLSDKTSCDRSTFNKLDGYYLVNELCENVDRNYSPRVGNFMSSVGYERMENLNEEDW